MKKFIQKSILYSSTFFLLLIAIDSSISLYVNSKANFKDPSSPTYIILGHSHPETAFNDSLIDNCKNYSESGESYFYTYQKLDKLLEQNPSIKTVFLEFTNNQLLENKDEWIFGKKYMEYRYPRYSSFMTNQNKFLLIKNNFKTFLNCFSLNTKHRMKLIIKDDYLFTKKIGKFKSLNFGTSALLYKS